MHKFVLLLIQRLFFYSVMNILFLTFILLFDEINVDLTLWIQLNRVWDQHDFYPIKKYVLKG